MEPRQSSLDRSWIEPNKKPDDGDSWIDDTVTIDERIAFRNVFFKDEDGMQVWMWLVFKLGYFKPTFTQNDATLRNFALELFHVLGLTDQEQLEMMVRHHKEVAKNDILHPQTRNKIRSKLDGRQS